MALITPAQIAPMYKNTIEDLLLAIINTLPVPSGNPAQFLNGQYNWVNGTSGTGTLPLGVTAIEDIPTNTSQIHFTQGTNIVFDCLLGTNTDDGITAYLGCGPDDGLMVYNGKFRVGRLIITQGASFLFPAFAAPSTWSEVIGVDDTEPLIAQIKISNLGKINILNKAKTAQLPIAFRDVTGTEAVVSLTNLGTVRANKLSSDNTGVLNYDATTRHHFAINAVNLLAVRLNNLGPFVDVGYDLGGTSYRFRNAFLNIWPAEPTTTDLPTSGFSFCKIAGTLYLVANDAGVIKKVALT